ncbi:PEP-CTERM sorting domain-containing protein [Sphingomonas bacterium]|uniref:PEP-CTERM sorting domain-containing protein n=1 Tax=Sphingomonas bacterium TaxID=1895847 RepID=UPI0020C5E277|nr:PEP-CTERM sorting domain-containing protein [Sphingomonas bacterium]
MWIAIMAWAGALAATPAAAADYLFEYGFNGVKIASGTITTDDTPIYPGSTNVINITGTRDGETISGFQDFFDVDQGDQQIYPGRPAAYVDDLGLTFQIGDYSYNITSPSANSGGGGNGFYTEYRYLTADPYGFQQSQFVSYFTLTSSPAAAVPEAPSWAMMLIGFGAIGFVARRRPVVRLGLVRCGNAEAGSSTDLKRMKIG